jgi:predicted Fe-S protein YdhL (DUF1289 family)
MSGATKENTSSAGVPSPCVDVCRMDEVSGWCLGCQRTLREIAAWSTLDDDDKRAIWSLLPMRRASLAPQPSDTSAAGSGEAP